MIIREEEPGDREGVYDVVRAAFGREDEARLVEALRGEGSVVVSLVATAEGDDRVVGHILFSDLRIASASGTLAAAALAPVAVRPEVQRRGIGAALVRSGLEACRGRGLGAVVVLGHPDYYPRFGFAPAATFRLRDPFAAGDAFMAMELVPGALASPGVPRYAPAFGLGG